MKAFTALSQMLREGFSLSGRERKCCFLNTHGERFACVSGVSGLDFDDDGRGVGLTDWDQDGDVDMWLVNRSAPRVRVMRNDTPQPGRSLTLRLQGTSTNRDAIGARVEVHCADGSSAKFCKTLRAGDGFLSQSSKWLTFGLGSSSAIDKVVVHWPGGEAETFSAAEPGGRFLLVQGAGAARRLDAAPRDLQLAIGDAKPLPDVQQARIVVKNVMPMPDVAYVGLDHLPHTLSENYGRPLFVNLWATWCQPCLQEMQEFSREADRFRAAGVEVLALNVDLLSENADADLEPGNELLKNLSFPFPAGALSPDGAGTFDVFHRAFLSLRTPLPLPSSFLVAPDGTVRCIYKGPITVDQLLADVRQIELPPAETRSYGLPLAGRWHNPPPLISPKPIAFAFMREGFLDEGVAYVTAYFDAYEARPNFATLLKQRQVRMYLADFAGMLADLNRLRGDRPGVVAAYQRALRYDPQFGVGHRDLASVLAVDGRLRESLSHFAAARELLPDDATVAGDFGVALAMSGNLSAAITEFEAALQLRPDFPSARANYARALQAVGRASEAIAQYRDLLQRKPQDSTAAAGLAWLLSTHLDSQVRNGAEALAALEPFTKSSTLEDTAVLNSLAAAYAELGRFDEAISTAERARDNAVKTQQAGLARACEQRLIEYRQRQPHREAPAPSSASE